MIFQKKNLNGVIRMWPLNKEEADAFFKLTKRKTINYSDVRSLGILGVAMVEIAPEWEEENKDGIDI